MSGTKVSGGTKKLASTQGSSSKISALGTMIRRVASSGTSGNVEKTRDCVVKSPKSDVSRDVTSTTASTSGSGQKELAVKSSGLVGNVLARIKSVAANKTNKPKQRHELLDVTATSSASIFMAAAKSAGHSASFRKQKRPNMAESVSGSSTKSRAIFCPAPERDIEREIDELDNEHRERMYADATWRMYDRIMTARASRPQPSSCASKVLASKNACLKSVRASSLHEGRSDVSDSSEQRRYQEYGGIFAIEDC